MVQLSKSPQNVSQVYLTCTDFLAAFLRAWFGGSTGIADISAQGSLAVDLPAIDAFPGKQNIWMPWYVTICVSVWHISLTQFLYKGKCFLT